MQFNTFIRLGSLAFNVAQDEKVRELVTMVHHGAKRRGFIYNGQAYPQQSQTAGQSGTAMQSQTVQPAAQQSHPIPFAPGSSQTAPSTGGQGAVVPGNLGKYLTANNAKKALKMAGDLGQFLIK